MLAQQLTNGLLLGATYALFALGFTLMFGVLRVINLTYGFYFSAGALVALWLARARGWHLGGLAGGGRCRRRRGRGVDWLLLTRLRSAKAPELASLMVTLGGVLALYSALTAWLGSDIRRLPPGVMSGEAIQLGRLRITEAQLLILAATALLVAALVLLMRGTQLGLAIRAMAERPDAAELMGIDTARAAAMVSFLSGCAGRGRGRADRAEAQCHQPLHGRGDDVARLRGHHRGRPRRHPRRGGRRLAARVGGGADRRLSWSSCFKEAVAFLMLVVVLWTRPSGLFGRAVARRA